ncbi:MAG: peptidoglycan DD-metalloendopeptidase family protein, partial [Propionibacteriaceae bacterium]|nr:peptidoglycan DD-metalloendopeptidase family protein [Propionibacteriaceae bacterium]
REKAAREKAERERKAKLEAEAKRVAEAKAKADRIARASRAAAGNSGASRSTERSEITQPARSEASTTRDSGFIMPVAGRLTSNYGMRLHPVLGYRKLHDGTDFGAACGTPIRAAADGVVTERYYNGGYGHRLMIDHGLVKGSYVTTGYNHATHYIVSVGKRVSQGQVVGYVGNTGYSTGCHLHLMVWDDGRVVNPMAYWFK